ncbi:MFS general substrate transporter [Anaeromyces robustus]|uniref:MFS general substrate transporter n=1 Tax=Anaeromyces robustus TaxID=1754192 RepID=A0A1Y1XJQ8_9FUNG|nr:MFS general substrate transporter [Anaeromyces robustus]|eukprot:ORX85696.1 MFS general substrate transporter [Anaeromyces robustus]
MTSIELDNMDGTTLDNSSIIINNENISIDIKYEPQKNNEEVHIKKVGGGGPEEPKFIPMLLTIISVLFFTALNESVATVMYTDLVHDLGKDITTIQWVTTGFVLVLAIGMIFSSFIAKNLYMRTIFFTSVIFFVSGSIICVIANSFIILLIGRIIQGVGTAMLMPQISNTVIIMAPKHRFGFYNGITMLIIITGNALGPTFSGLITRYLGWRYVFAMIIPIPVIGGIIGYWTVGNIIHQENSKLDILSVILGILGYGGISFGLGNTGTYGFGSRLVIISLIIGIICLILFFIWEATCKNPMVSLKNMGRPYFILNVFLSTVNCSTLLGWLAILPFVIQNALGKSVSIGGLALLPGGIINALLNVFAGRIYDKYRFKYAPIGFLIIILSSLFAFIMCITDHMQLWVIIISYTCVNMGLPIVQSIYTSSCLTSVPPQSSPHAAAIYHSFFQLFGALGSAIYVAFLNNFNTVSFSSSVNPLINGASVCFILTMIITGILFIIGLCWSIIYFRNHDNKGNPKHK